MPLLQEEGGAASLLGLGIVLPVAIFVLVAGRWLLERHERRAGGRKFGTEAIFLTLVLVALVAIVMSLPLESSERGQLLNFLGVLLSAALVLSSTTLLGNILAGFMLRGLRNHQVGDFLRCGEHFGRVTERGLLHTEIQTEERLLTTLPNLYLVSNPITVTRRSGAIVSADVSLGYDVPRGDVREALLAAAEAAELTDPFVRILELGDHAVTYRISGLVSEVKKNYVSAPSRLRGRMLDSLHRAGIEIVSPGFRNLRELARDRRIIPRVAVGEVQETPAVEEVIFDKAVLVETLGALRKERKNLEAEQTELERRRKESADEQVKGALADEVARLGRRLEGLSELIESREADLAAEDDE